MKNSKFVGIGKIVLESLNTDTYNIPHLHFIFQKNGNFIEAINLEFGLVSTDTTPDNAVKELVSMLIEYIQRNITTYSFQSLIDVVASDAMNEYWTEYRKLEFMLAEQKKDVGNNFVNTLKRAITNEILKTYGIKPKAKFSVLKDAA